MNLFTSKNPDLVILKEFFSKNKIKILIFLVVVTLIVLGGGKIIDNFTGSRQVERFNGNKIKEKLKKALLATKNNEELKNKLISAKNDDELQNVLVTGGLTTDEIKDILTSTKNSKEAKEILNIVKKFITEAGLKEGVEELEPGDIFPVDTTVTDPESPEDPQSNEEVQLSEAKHRAIELIHGPMQTIPSKNIIDIVIDPAAALISDEHRLHGNTLNPQNAASNKSRLEEESEMILGDSPGLKQPKAFCSTNEDCNVVFGDGKNICSIEGVCICNKGGSGRFCHMGPTNYKDPKDMTADQRRRFKERYRIDFTLQDYKNWLKLYKRDSDPDNLPPEHEANYKKFAKGGELKVKDLPRKLSGRRLTAADKFMTINRNRFSLIPFPFGGDRDRDERDLDDPDNQDDQGNPIERDNGTVFQNPRQIGRKVVDFAELAPKRSARALRQYLGPSFTESADNRNFQF